MRSFRVRRVLRLPTSPRWQCNGSRLERTAASGRLGFQALAPSSCLTSKVACERLSRLASNAAPNALPPQPSWRWLREHRSRSYNARAGPPRCNHCRASLGSRSPRWPSSSNRRGLRRTKCARSLSSAPRDSGGQHRHSARLTSLSDRRPAPFLKTKRPGSRGARLLHSRSVTSRKRRRRKESRSDQLLRHFEPGCEAWPQDPR